MKKACSVLLRIRAKIPVEGKLEFRYVEPVYHAPKAKNSKPKLKPLVAKIGKKETHHPEGVYALRYGRKYENVGTDAEAALCAFERKKKTLEAKAAGVEVVENGVPSSVKNKLDEVLEAVKPTEKPKRNFKAKVDEYIKEIRQDKKDKTYHCYKITVEGFFAACGRTDENPSAKLNLEDLDREDVRNYIRTLKAKSLGNRTVRNRVDFLKTFFLHFDLSWPLKTKDIPEYTEKFVTVYDPEAIQTILSAATPDEYDLLSFFLCTGGREQDVEFARWPNIHFRTKKFLIEENLPAGYTPKDREEAAIPIPDYLIDLLRARRKRNLDAEFIFPTERGKPDRHLLRIVKRVALRAGLNCGHCKTKRGLSCRKHPVCKTWILHTWRKCFATYHHRNGFPARQIQKWLRHSDLETTLRYLACADDESPETRQQVNSTFDDFVRKPALVPESA
ncbi:MAG: tyrosine-type recombinase/integrase [Bryobacteraceae bacterium]